MNSGVKSVTKPSQRNELEITDALDMLLNENNNINFDMITDYWKDTGTPDDIINANSQILEQLDSKIDGVIENDVIVNGKIISIDEYSITHHQ